VIKKKDGKKKEFNTNNGKILIVTEYNMVLSDIFIFSFSIIVDIFIINYINKCKTQRWLIPRSFNQEEVEQIIYKKLTINIPMVIQDKQFLVNHELSIFHMKKLSFNTNQLQKYSIFLEKKKLFNTTLFSIRQNMFHKFIMKKLLSNIFL
jgi:hypothetical protein